MCQEAILLWFRKILNIQYGTYFIDLIDGILVGQLLNKFNSHQFPLFKEECLEQQFIFNFARINQINENMFKYYHNLLPVTPLKIVEGMDENELNKFVFNIIQIIQEWDLAKEAFSTLRNDQIQYINQFINKEEDDDKCQQIFQKLVEYENINSQQEQQIIQLTQDNQNLLNKIIILKQENEQYKQEIKNKIKQIEKLELDNVGKSNEMTVEYFKQENINLQSIVQNLEKRNELQRQQIQMLIKFEQKCQDLENEISNFHTQKQFEQSLNNKSQTQDKQKTLNDSLRALQENLNQQNIQSLQIENYEKEIKYLKNQIQQLENQLIQEQKESKELKDLKEQKDKMTPKKKYLETPRPPKQKMNCLSDQKYQRNQNNEEKLMKQIQLLRQIIDEYGIQQKKQLILGQRIVRGKSLNN